MAKGISSPKAQEGIRVFRKYEKTFEIDFRNYFIKKQLYSTQASSYKRAENILTLFYIRTSKFRPRLAVLQFLLIFALKCS